jgi:hypothetical protein
VPDDHFRARAGRDGHNSRVSKKPQTPMNNTKLRRNATTFPTSRSKWFTLMRGSYRRASRHPGQ